MTGTIIPLRTKRDDQAALARVDLLAAELLAEGKAGTLSEARIEALVAKLKAQRADLLTLIADLQARDLSGNTQIDAINADLSTAANIGIVRINQVIEQLELQRPRK